MTIKNKDNDDKWEFIIQAGHYFNSFNCVFYAIDEDKMHEKIIDSFNEGLAHTIVLKEDEDIPNPTMKLTMAMLQNMHLRIGEFLIEQAI